MLSVSGPGFQLRTHDSYMGLQLQGASGCVRASGLGQEQCLLEVRVGALGEMLSGKASHLNRVARAHCPSLLRSITRSQPQCGLKSDVYRPFRDHAAYPVSELFIQGLRTQTFSGMQALQPCVVQSQAVCERCERL